VYLFKPEYILLSCTIPVNLHELSTIVDEQRLSDIEDSTKIIIGGNALEFLTDPKHSIKANFVISNYSELLELLS